LFKFNLIFNFIVSFLFLVLSSLLAVVASTFTIVLLKDNDNKVSEKKIKQ